MRDLSISTVRSPFELKAFIECPWEVYKENPYWVPPLLSERTSFHDPDQNPFFDHATVQYFLARREGKLVGTIAAFTNQAYNDFRQTNVGFFGFSRYSKTARPLLRCWKPRRPGLGMPAMTSCSGRPNLPPTTKWVCS